MKAIIVGLAVLVISTATAFAFLRPPAMSDARFSALSGENFSLSELHGKVVLVNFWATYCTSCMQEMPKMVDTYRKFAPRGYEMVAVAVKHDHPDRVAEFAARRALPFKVALDSSGDIALRFGNVRITPMSFLIDKKGRVLKRYVGEPDWAEFHQLVERALAS